MIKFKMYVPIILTIIFCFSCSDTNTSIGPITLTGEIEWQKTYGGSGDDKGRAIIQTSDGGYAITGPSKSADGDGSANQGQHDHWIVKLDPRGDIEWEKSHGFSGHDHSRSIFQTNDGGFFIGGYLDVDSSGGLGNETVNTKHGVGEFWAQKLDATGNLEWRRYFGGTMNDRIFKVLQAHDGNFLLIGSAISNDGDISNSKGNSDAWVIKIDENGKLLWEKSFGGSAFDAAWAIDNGSGIFSSYVVAGNSKSSDTNVSENNGENDFWVFKIDGSGKLLFEKSLGGSGLDFAYGVVETLDQKIVVVGETESNDIDITSHKGGKDIWIAKIK